MRGQLVVCREFNGVLIERTVWEDTESLVFIHTEDQFEAHTGRKPYLEPVGFPVNDVFIPAEAGDWERLLPYRTHSLAST